MKTCRPALLLVLMFLAGCSHKTLAPSANRTAGPSAPILSPDLPALPAPKSLESRLAPHAASYVPADLTKLGKDFEAALPHQRLVAAGNSGTLTPDWDAPSHVAYAGLSFGMYDFAVKGYAGSAQLHYAWGTAPGNPGDAYFAIANWDTGRWEWYQGSVGGVIALPAIAPYIDFGGSLLVCVMRVGTDASALDSLQLGTAPPVPTLRASPNFGLAPLTVNLDATGSLDPDGTIVKYEWDPEGDGTFETSTADTPTFSFVYTTPGQYAASVRVTDDSGTFATATVTVKAVTQVSFTYDSENALDRVNSAFVDSAGNLCLFGFVSSVGKPDAMFMKLAPTGDSAAFVKSWGGENNDELYDATGSAGDLVYACGTTDVTIINTGKGLLQCWNTDGSLLWSKRVRSTEAGDAIALDGICATGNALYVSGAFYDSAIDRDLGLLMRFDLQGNMVWAKSVIAPAECNLSSVKFQENLVTGSSSVRCCGSYNTGLSYDMFYGSFSPDGDVLTTQLWGDDDKTELGSKIYLTGIGNAATFIAGTRGFDQNAVGVITRIGGNSVEVSNAGGVRSIALQGTARAPLTAVFQTNLQTSVADFDLALATLGSEKVGCTLPHEFVAVAANRFSTSGLLVVGIKRGTEQISDAASDDSILPSSTTWRNANPSIGSPTVLEVQDTVLDVGTVSGYEFDPDRDADTCVWIESHQ